MENYSTLIRTDRYPVIWGDSVDGFPPAGYEFACALKNKLDERVQTQHHSAFTDTSFQDTYEWYFWVNYKEDTYYFNLLACITEYTPPYWLITFHKWVSRGLAGCLPIVNRFISKPDYSIDPDFVTIVEESVKSLSGLDSIEWGTHEEKYNTLMDLID